MVLLEVLMILIDWIDNRIDHNFVKNVLSDTISSYISSTSITDHFSTIAVTDCSAVFEKYNRKISVNCANEYYTKINFSVMNNLLKIENWKKLLFGLSVYDMCSAFQSKLSFAVSHASTNINRNYHNKFVLLKVF